MKCSINRILFAGLLFLLVSSATAQDGSATTGTQSPPSPPLNPIIAYLIAILEPLRPVYIPSRNALQLLIPGISVPFFLPLDPVIAPPGSTAAVVGPDVVALLQAGQAGSPGSGNGQGGAGGNGGSVAAAFGSGGGVVVGGNGGAGGAGGSAGPGGVGGRGGDGGSSFVASGI